MEISLSEFGMNKLFCFINDKNQHIDNLNAEIIKHLPERNYKKIVIKPNWVMHQENDEFPIDTLITNTNLIDATIETCLKKYNNLEKISIGDAPLQICNWELMIKQSTVNSLIEKYKNFTKPKIFFLDLRKERYKMVNGFMELDSNHNGDPLGYCEVVLNQQSLLDEISKNSNKFRVSDFDPKETTSVHLPGNHRYMIARTALEADLVINLAKMKTHQKAGITGALKNLVGINGSKAHLVHYQKGLPSQGGDEFPESISRLFLLQVRLRELLQKRSKFLFRLLKFNWNILKQTIGIKTLGTKENLEKGNIYIGAGSWYGNDSIWRMVYDLNMIILFGHKDGGRLREEKQRDYLCILDGYVSGEGNGPLQPLPVNSNVCVISGNPFLIDFAVAKMMGFDFNKIKILKKYNLFPHQEWTDFNPYEFNVQINSETRTKGIDSIPVVKKYLPPPGWKGHIELL